MDQGCGDEAVLSCCEGELKKLAKPIKEACISPAMKRELYQHLCFLLELRHK